MTGGGRSMAARMLAMAAVLAAFGAACGDGRGSGPEARPARDATASVGGSFRELPLPPLADPLGPEHVADDGTVVRSYAVRNRTVRSAMDFYAEQLADRTVVTPISDVGGGGAVVLQGEWRYQDRRLRITAGPAPGVEGIQVSLELHPG